MILLAAYETGVTMLARVDERAAVEPTATEVERGHPVRGEEAAGVEHGLE